MNWLLAALCFVALVEVAVRLPFGLVVAGLVGSGTKAARVVGARSISDHWKEKALAAYARSTFLASIRLAGLLVVLFGVAALLILGLERVSRGFLEFVLGWRGIAFGLLLAGFYLAARRAVFHGRL